MVGKNIGKILCALSALSLAMAIIALALVHLNKQTSPTAKNSQFCRPLQEGHCFNDSLMDMFAMSDGKTGNELRCYSYKDTKQMLLALNTVWDCHQLSGLRPNANLRAPDAKNFSSARLRMMPSSNKNDHNSVSMIFIEPSMSTASEHRRNVEIRPRDTIVILVSGIYHVYANINFYQDPDKVCHYMNYEVEERTVTVLLTELKSQNQGRKLLTVTHSCCGHCRMDEETRENGTIVLLHQHDVLRVTVFPSGVVRSSSYLGLVTLWLVQ